MGKTFPMRFKALPVEQNLGRYFVTVLPARLLLEVAHSRAAYAQLTPEGRYRLEGNQRFINDARLRQIGEYISRADSAFPNAIILAANVPMRGQNAAADDLNSIDQDELADDDDASWTVEGPESGDYYVVIPSKAKLAAVVDGQHRLFSFAKPEAAAGLNTQMICSVFFDIVEPIQAQLFATINSTQKRVDKSLTYELFGYNVEEEAENTWTPTKLAVFFARRLNIEERSPLRGRVMVAPRRDSTLTELAKQASWRVSTAVVVEGILRLISSKPVRDSNRMGARPGLTRAALSELADRSPLREQFLGVQDKLIYAIVWNYLRACDEVFWQEARPGSYIVKTVGIQALFDVLRAHVPAMLADRNLTMEAFMTTLEPAARIDFAGDRFRSPSGSGRTAIKQAIIDALA